jgi:hypothetical protein
MNDDELHSLIRETHPKPEFPTSFQREVWARIAVAEQQSWAVQWRQFLQILFHWIARPAHAVALVASMVIVGAGLGSLTAADNSVSAQRNAYAASINPVTAAHDTTHR